MADQIETPAEDTKPAETAPDIDVSPEPAPDETPAPASRGNAEAAKYRTRLRAAEAERDTIRDQLTQARGQILDQALDQRFRSVLKLSGRDISDLFTDDGTIDIDALEKLGTELAAEYPGMIDQKRGQWEQLDDEPTLQLLKNERAGAGAVAPFDTDEGRSPSANLAGNQWEDAFTPKA